MSHEQLSRILEGSRHTWMTPPKPAAEPGNLILLLNSLKAFFGVWKDAPSSWRSEIQALEKRFDELRTQFSKISELQESFTKDRDDAAGDVLQFVRKNSLDWMERAKRSPTQLRQLRELLQVLQKDLAA